MADSEKTLTQHRLYNLLSFKKVMFKLILDGFNHIDAEKFYHRCKSKSSLANVDFEIDYFYALLQTSHCFVVDNGTHGTVHFPRVILDWDKTFLEETGELFK